MKAIIGLGNPGREYELTRHNAGFLVVDQLMEKACADWSKSRYNGLYGRINLGSQSALLGKPMTYMNRSGHFISSLLHYFRVEVEDLLVVHDEMDLPAGRIRLARGGGSAGHRGVDSTIEQLGTRSFSRLRVGVGKPPRKEQVVGHVLSRFGGDEEALFGRTIELSAEACAAWVENGITAAMNQYNGLQLELDTQEGGD